MMIAKNKSDTNHYCVEKQLQSQQFCSDQPPSVNTSISPNAKQSSFFHRILPFGNGINQQFHNKPVKSDTKNCNVCCGDGKKARTISRDEFKSVQSLKKFWSSAFGTNSKSVSTIGLEQCGCIADGINLPDRDKCMSLDRDNVKRDCCCLCCSAKKCSSSPHRKSGVDNFYKYKTADLVKNNRISDIHSSCGAMKHSAAMLSKCNDDDDVNDDATAIDACRLDIKIPSSVVTDGNKLNTEMVKNYVKDDIVLLYAEDHIATITTEPDKQNCISNENNNTSTTIDHIKPSHIIMEVDNIKTHTCTDDNNDVDALQTNEAETDKITMANVDRCNVSYSKSTSSSTTNSLVSSDSPRKQGSSSSRKCSFRTNSFHHHLHHHHHHHHHNKKMAAGGGGGSGSKVAALTHRFNQLIQQDAEIQAEVKRNKEVILHRVGGHVFKVKEDVDSGSSSGGSVKKRTGTKRTEATGEQLSNGSPQKQVKKKPSVKRRSSIKSGSKPGTVKAAIRVFESDTTDGQVCVSKKSEPERRPSKPKVPDKSAEVLQRTKEITLKRIKVTTTSPNATLVDEPKPLDNKGEVTTQTIAEKRITLEKIKEVDEKKEELELDTIQCPEVPNKNSTLPIMPTNEASDSEPATEDNKTKKSKYTRLYEKLRFKSSFLSASKKYVHAKAVSTTEISEPDQKIVDAICTVNERIEQLSKSENCLTRLDDDEDRHYQRVTENMKPNISFLFRSTSTVDKTTFGSDLFETPPNDVSPVEAINPCCISKTRSMDEIHFSSQRIGKNTLLKQISLEERNFGAICQKIDAIIDTAKGDMAVDHQDDDYEVVTKPETSFVHRESKRAAKYSSAVKDVRTDSSDIYQSISEARSGQRTAAADTKGAEQKDCDSLNSYESFENYEAVDELRLNVSNNNTTTTNHNENNYEICDPPEPPPPRIKVIDTGPATTTPQSSSSFEPILPAPKRLFTSNPLPIPVATAFRNETAPAPVRPPKLPTDKGGLALVEPVYAGVYRDYDYDSENIYDTIKTVDNTLTVNGGGSGDYESISSVTSFLRSNRVLKHADSTSTLSSDNKTNSLYGTTSALGGRGITPPSEGGSDNSDEWIDISDGEGDVKHKFVV